MIVKQDTLAQTIRIDPDTSLLRIDGMIICKITRNNNGEVSLQFKDNDRMRSRCRGTAFVEVPLPALEKAILKDLK